MSRKTGLVRALKSSLTLVVDAKPLRLDLGCGQNKAEGFTGVDMWPGADIRHDLLSFPWPFKDDSVEEVRASHFFEHIPGPMRPRFMNELNRIMKKGAQATFITPYWNSPRAIQDYTHEWPPICENSYLYFNKGWREQNKLSHYEATCDFDFTYGYSISDPVWQGKQQQARDFGIKHYQNVIDDLHVVLTKR